MKKKILTAIIGCLMVMSLAACGANESKEAKEASPKFEKAAVSINEATEDAKTLFSTHHVRGEKEKSSEGKNVKGFFEDFEGNKSHFENFKEFKNHHDGNSTSESSDI